MAETTADVRRDIELTRERMSQTLSQLEGRVNLTQIVRDNPWPAVAVAFGAGLLLSGSKADVKAARVTKSATAGAGSRFGPAVDDVVARLMAGLTDAFYMQVDRLVDEVRGAIGAPPLEGEKRAQLYATHGVGEASASANLPESPSTRAD